MMTMMRLGLRNLLRNKSRLVIVALLIGIPFFLLMVMQTIGDSVERQTNVLKQSVNNTLQVRARGSMGHVNMTGNDSILPQETLEKVKAFEHVVKVEPYLLAMTPTEGHNFAMIVGVNAGDNKRLESHGEVGNPKLLAGRDLTEADHGKRVAIIGQGFAKYAEITSENIEQATLTLDLSRTHPVIFELKRPPATLKIVGIFASGYVFGDMQLFMPLDTFREIYGVPSGLSWLYIKAASSEHLPGIEKKLASLFGEQADILAPTNIAEFQNTTTATVLRLSKSGILLSAALMVITVFFVMLLVVRERAKEIGTLKAIGASNGGIVLGFLTEAVALSAVGALLGTLAFAAWGGPVIQKAFGVGVAPFLPPEYKDTLINAMTLSPDVGASTLALLAATCVLAAFAGSAWSIRQLIRLSPMEAIRHE